MNKRIIKIIIYTVIFLLTYPTINAYAEEEKTLELQLTYANGEPVVLTNVTLNNDNTQILSYTYQITKANEQPIKLYMVLFGLLDTNKSYTYKLLNKENQSIKNGNIISNEFNATDEKLNGLTLILDVINNIEYTLEIYENETLLYTKSIKIETTENPSITSVELEKNESFIGVTYDEDGTTYFMENNDSNFIVKGVGFNKEENYTVEVLQSYMDDAEPESNVKEYTVTGKQLIEGIKVPFSKINGDVAYYKISIKENENIYGKELYVYHTKRENVNMELSDTTLKEEMINTIKATSLKGDMNKDGTINFADVIIALRINLGIDDANEIDTYIGDINNKNGIEFGDIISILRLYLGIA